MRILRSIHSLNPEIGGPIESVRRSSAEMERRGHEVSIATLDAPDAPWLTNVSAHVHALGPGRGSYGYSARFVPWLRAQRRRFDAVIVHGIWQYSSFGVWRALHGTDTPYFVFTHGMLDPWFNRTYPLKKLKKQLYWRWGEYRVLRDAAAVLFTSEEERRLARQSFSPFSCKEVVVNYGTSAPTCDLIAARERFFTAFETLRGKRILLFLGRLHEKKGADLAIRGVAAATRDDPNVHLVLAGPAANDAYVAQLNEVARNCGVVDRVTLTGMLSGEMKWGALAAADAFILPSHQENFGIAVVEALACGTPVLISNKVNIWREITGDDAGLADDDDLAGTERIVHSWLTLPTARAAAMRENALRCFATRFDIGSATENLLSVIAQQVND